MELMLTEITSVSMVDSLGSPITDLSTHIGSDITVSDGTMSDLGSIYFIGG